MPYRIRHGQPLPAEIRRIAEEQIDRALAEIADPDLGPYETVHQVRKRCKKVRAVLRLLRGPLDADDTYSTENAWYRDAAAELSHTRDAEALIETYDRLMDHFADEVDRSAFGPIRRQLTLRRQDLAARGARLDNQLAEFADRMRQGRERIGSWARQAEDFGALAPGLAKSYRRGRKAMALAYAEPSAANFHDWRKRTKYHWYHCRLLRDLWRRPMDARRRETGRLADLLGDEHDLSVLRATLLGEPDAFVQGTARDAFLALIERRREKLRGKAAPLGARIYAEKPKHLVRRLQAWWDV